MKATSLLLSIDKFPGFEKKIVRFSILIQLVEKEGLTKVDFGKCFDAFVQTTYFKD